MAWRFRKSFSPIPGVRLTLSPSGISTSVGSGPLRLTVGPSGAVASATIPGTGLSFRQPLVAPDTSPPAPGRGYAPAAKLPLVQPVLPPVATAPGMQEIRSAGSSMLTTPGLEAFKASLAQAHQQFKSISAELAQAKADETAKVDKRRGWEGGFLFKRLFKAKFAEIKAQAQEAEARRSELDEQLTLSTLQTEFEMPDGVAKAFARFCDDFSACARSQRIWDNVAHRASNRVVERTTASRIVDLKPVRFGMGKCGVIATAQKVPRLENANGGDLYFYPGFLVYHASDSNYALIEYHELDLSVVRTQFQEEQAVPTDAERVGTTWAKANKDGSPDRRFSNNYEIPVMRYARLLLTTRAGLNEEYVLSNAAATEQFGVAWQELIAAVKAGR